MRRRASQCFNMVSTARICSVAIMFPTSTCKHSVLPPAGAACGNPYMEYVALMDAVNSISEACEGTETVRVRSVRSDRAKHRHWEELVARQWTERIEGGYGCWVGCEVSG